jgi:hypothetical protein
VLSDRTVGAGGLAEQVAAVPEPSCATVGRGGYELVRRNDYTAAETPRGGLLAYRLPAVRYERLRLRPADSQLSHDHVRASLREPYILLTAILY